MIFKKIIFPSFFLLVAQGAMAQGGATIKVSVNKNRILIGEPIELTIEASFTSDAVKKIMVINEIEHFEILRSLTVDSTYTDGMLRIKETHTITSFDSGHWVIPAYSLTETVKSDTIPVDVVFSDFDPTQEYHDIKDVVDVKVNSTGTPWWWYAAGGLLLLVLIGIAIANRKKKPAAVARPVATANPYEEALQQLDRLQKENPEAKLYYSSLVDIFKLYVYRKKGILSLQKTTDDLVVQLKGLGLPKEQFDKLSQSLRLSDFVKFAKYVPAEDDDKKSFQEIRNAIITIEKTETGSPSLGGSQREV